MKSHRRTEQSSGQSQCPKNLDRRVRELLIAAIKRSPKSRAQVSDGMSTLLGINVSVRMLDDWTAQSKCRVRFPLAFVEAFCEVTEDSSLRKLLLGERQTKLLQSAILELAAHRERAELLSADEVSDGETKGGR